MAASGDTILLFSVSNPVPVKAWALPRGRAASLLFAPQGTRLAALSAPGQPSSLLVLTQVSPPLSPLPLFPTFDAQGVGPCCVPSSLLCFCTLGYSRCTCAIVCVRAFFWTCVRMQVLCAVQVLYISPGLCGPPTLLASCFPTITRYMALL